MTPIETTPPVALAGLLLIAAVLTFCVAGVILSIINNKNR